MSISTWRAFHFPLQYIKINLCFHLFNQYLLSTYCVSGSEEAELNKTKNIVLFLNKQKTDNEQRSTDMFLMIIRAVEKKRAGNGKGNAKVWLRVW